MLSRARQSLVPILIDGVGARSRGDFRAINEGIPAYQIDFDGDPLDPNDDVVLDTLREGRLVINGTRVTEDMLVDTAAAFAERNRRDPTPQELLEMIAAVLGQ